MNLHEILKQITPPDGDARREAQRRWDACAKPLGSLGLLETAICDIAALTGSADVRLLPRAVLVLCADNGVVRQGVTQTDSSVMAAVARALARGCSSVGCMAARADCRVVPVDMGIRDFPGCEGILDRRAGNGTGDLSEGPAMTRQQAEAAIRTGMELVRAERERGTRLLAGGEMGIGNTTTSSAVTAYMLGVPVEEITGRGAGLSDEGLRKKVAAIRRAIEVNAPDPADPLDILAKLGGFDIAGMAGMFLGGALYRVPVVIDGLISSVSALIAARLCPNAKKGMIASHCSAEPAAEQILRELGLVPVIRAGLKLGEGTGAACMLPLLDMALAVYHGSAAFADAGVEQYTIQEGDER